MQAWLCNSALRRQSAKRVAPLALAFDIALPQGHRASFQGTRKDQKLLIMPSTGTLGIQMVSYVHNFMHVRYNQEFVLLLQFPKYKESKYDSD